MKISYSIKSLILYSLAFITYLLPVKSYSQQAGTLDSAFGNNGVVYVDSTLQYVPYQDSQNRFVSVVRQNDSTLALYRHLIDGTLDNTFGNNGQMLLQCDSAEIYFLRIQNDDKILCAGTIQHIPDTVLTNQTDFFIARFFPDGSVDTLFGNQGKVVVDFGQNELPADMIMYNDSLILVSGRTGYVFWGAGNTDVTLLLLLPDGTPDSSFGLGGKVITSLSNGIDQGGKLAILPGGKIFMGANFGRLAFIRYEVDGLLDSTFANYGIAIDSATVYNSYDFELENDFSIIVAGGGGSVFGGGYFFELKKYHPDGTTDISFALNGTYYSSWSGTLRTFNSLKIQGDHKIVATGIWNDSLLLMRFTSKGYPDSTFASQGTALNQFDGLNCSGNLVSLFPNGKITVVGYATNQVDTNKMLIVRYNNDIFNAIPFEPADDYGLSVFPNPVSNHLNIICTDHFKFAIITISDITGKIIYKKIATAPDSPDSYRDREQKLEINTSDFAEGVYLVQIQTERFIETKKVIVTK